MAQELLEKYQAPHCAKLVLEAAEIYEKGEIPSLKLIAGVDIEIPQLKYVLGR